MKFIILGDVHLGKSVSIGKSGSPGKLNSRIQDQIDLLNWTLKQAIDNGVNIIFITGDIYEEPRPHPALINYFMSWLKECEKAGVNVHVLVGNHDIVKSGNYTVSALDIVPAVEMSHAKTYKNPATLNFPGVSFTLLPYRDRRMYDADSPEKGLELLKKEFEAEINNLIPGNVKVLIGHLAIEGSLYIGDEIDDMLNELFCPISMFKDYDYVWMGHIHKPQVLNKEKPYISHVGSADRSSFHKDELEYAKIIILINTDNTDFFTEIKLPTRSLRKIEIDVPQDKDTTDYIVNYIYNENQERSIENAIVRIEARLQDQHGPSADRDKIYKFVCGKLNAHHLCNFTETRVIQPITYQDCSIFDNNIGIPSAIEAYLNVVDIEEKKQKEELKDLLLEVYDEYKQSKQAQQEI